MLILVIGDAYIPFNASDLPLKFKKLLTPGKISKIFCTGNLNLTLTADYLKTICNDITFVGGEFDSIPVTTKIIQINQLRFGLVSGYTLIPWNRASEIKARECNVDVLISGFGSEFYAKEIESRFYVNPGSCTGSYFQNKSVKSVKTNEKENHVENVPSFVLMDVHEADVVFYIYKLINGDVKVEKMEFTKKLVD